MFNNRLFRFYIHVFPYIAGLVLIGVVFACIFALFKFIDSLQ